MTRLPTTIALLSVSIILVATIFLTRKFSPLPHTGHSVFNTPPESIRLIKITQGSESYELKKRPPNWHITATNFKDLADTQQIKKILHSIASLTWSNRIPASKIPTTDALAPYGLKKPKLTIEIHSRSKKKLHLGAESTIPGHIYARFDKSREILLVQDSLTELIPTSPQELRSRKLSDVPPSQIDRILIKNHLGEIEFRNAPTGWQIVKPLSAKADDQKINNLISNLLNSQVLEFLSSDTANLAHYGIIEGQNEIVLFAEGKERPQILRLGNMLPPNQQKTYAQSTARDSIFILPSSTRQLLNIIPHKLRDMRLITFTLDAIDRIRITLPDKILNLNRKADSWILDSTHQTISPDLSSLTQLLDLLTNTKASEFIQHPAESSDTLLTIELLSILSENTPEATAGEFPISTLKFSRTRQNSIVSIIPPGENALLEPSALDALLATIANLDQSNDRPHK